MVFLVGRARQISNLANNETVRAFALSLFGGRKVLPTEPQGSDFHTGIYSGTSAASSSSVGAIESETPIRSDVTVAAGGVKSSSKISAADAGAAVVIELSDSESEQHAATSKKMAKGKSKAKPKAKTKADAVPKKMKIKAVPTASSSEMVASKNAGRDVEAADKTRNGLEQHSSALERDVILQDIRAFFSSSEEREMFEGCVADIAPCSSVFEVLQLKTPTSFFILQLAYQRRRPRFSGRPPQFPGSRHCRFGSTTSNCSLTRPLRKRKMQRGRRKRPETHGRFSPEI
ncbi:unnamed protein product [Amoebophrya sp. A120]|nr:unnamed protein product [Amoebophrya sp. A120]|eukprot:GSA120T00011406001.1